MTTPKKTPGQVAETIHKVFQDAYLANNGLYAEAVNAGLSAVLAHAAPKYEAEIARLKHLLDDRSRGIHSCSHLCERPLCVLGRENERLRADHDKAIDALETLCDLQNGPPLAKYETAWTEAMDKAANIILLAKKENHNAKG